MATDSKLEFETYLTACRASKTEPNEGVVKAWEKAIALEAAAPAEPGFTPPAVNSAPEVTTQQFLSDQNRDEWRRRNQLDADAVLAAPAYDADAEQERRKREFGRFQIGSLKGSTKITGDTP